jgi:hypothetical protein
MTTAHPVLYASQTSESADVRPPNAAGARHFGIDASLASFIFRAVLAVGLLGTLIIH